MQTVVVRAARIVDEAAGCVKEQAAPMLHPVDWVGPGNVALLTDLYELTMLHAYWREDMNEEAVFSLFSRKLPPSRNYLLACGLDDALRFLEDLRFSPESLEYLSTLPYFSTEFLDWLEGFRFRGSVYAVPEGTPVFGHEPLLEVVASLPEAQLAESFVMNQVHFQTVVASKASRVVTAAQGRPVVDFGLRRMHGSDAGLKAARAFHIAGVSATSNVLAGQVYGIPVAGTMAHSYIQAHESELEAFRRFSELYPETILLVDTYDTLEGVGNVIRLSKELGSAFRIRGIRLDSGDLASLARESRAALDGAGLDRLSIFASGGLDEDEIARLVREAPFIGGFGVGTKMGVSEDAPALDMAYKATSYAGRGRLKLAFGKKILPGRKQIFRIEENGEAVRDVLARHDEALPGRPLMQKVMEAGKRLPCHAISLDSIRENRARELALLPAPVRALSPAAPSYPVEMSAELERYREEVTSRVRGV
jgi:nicotinate phosphoribosyltransferase